ncbi:MAG: agmatinase, partial [Candidatus Glassbacteria bacterium RBG_16_58_8]
MQSPEEPIQDTLPPFLDIKAAPARDGTFGMTVFPIPYEKTTSYVRGTARAPLEIVKASQQVELYDDETGVDLSSLSLLTESAILAESLDALEKQLTTALTRRTFPILIGGGHTLTLPALRTLSRGRPLSVLSLDAHADMRDEFLGSMINHATVMRRVSEICPVIVAGVRSISPEEMSSLHGLPVRLYRSHDLIRGTLTAEEIIHDLRGDVYLSVDVDVFDPSLVPSVGTPEPGGLDWYQVTGIIRRVFEERVVVGMDVVELCPQPHQHAAVFTVAKMIFKAMCYLYASDPVRFGRVDSA